MGKGRQGGDERSSWRQDLRWHLLGWFKGEGESGKALRLSLGPLGTRTELQSQEGGRRWPNRETMRGCYLPNSSLGLKAGDLLCQSRHSLASREGAGWPHVLPNVWNAFPMMSVYPNLNHLLGPKNDSYMKPLPALSKCMCLPPLR